MTDDVMPDRPPKTRFELATDLSWVGSWAVRPLVPVWFLLALVISLASVAIPGPESSTQLGQLLHKAGAYGAAVLMVRPWAILTARTRRYLVKREDLPYTARWIVLGLACVGIALLGLLAGGAFVLAYLGVRSLG